MITTTTAMQPTKRTIHLTSLAALIYLLAIKIAHQQSGIEKYSAQRKSFSTEARKKPPKKQINPMTPQKAWLSNKGVCGIGSREESALRRRMDHRNRRIKIFLEVVGGP